MSGRWPQVRLGEVLRRCNELAELSSDRTYREITVKLWGKGVILRGVALGSALLGARRFVARTGDLILSKIDARNGAIGIVPLELDGAVVTQDFPLFTHDRLRLDLPFLGWLTKTSAFVQLCAQASEGTTNRIRLKEERFLNLKIPLPPLEEQRRIVEEIEAVAKRVKAVRSLQEQQMHELYQALCGEFRQCAENATLKKMADIAPQVRRPVVLDSDGIYPELGIRSFGKGTFHKPALTALEIGEKRVFRIEPGDLVFSNVFAWEGAIAVAQMEDAARVGSHRYITCVARPDQVLADFLCFYFLTQEGLEKIRSASPGGAGRNRTLGLSALDAIEVPVPLLERQRSFCKLLRLERSFRHARVQMSADLDAVISNTLSKSF